MTTPRSPEGEMVDIMDLDREIDALLRGHATTDDEGLGLLLELRDSVDLRAAELLGDREAIAPPAAKRPTGTVTRRRHHRLAVIPAAAALVLASTGAAAAFSSSPGAAFYPLHRLIFGPAPSSDRQLERDLAQAQTLLDHAAAEPYSVRAGDLAQARLVLASAQSLLPMAASRTQFSQEISAALARLRELETPPTTGKLGPLPVAAPSSPAETPSGSEEPAAPESAKTESETSGVTPGVVESDAPETVTPSSGWTGPTPEAETSGTPSPVRSESGDPSRSSAPSSETEPRDN